MKRIFPLILIFTMVAGPVAADHLIYAQKALEKTFKGATHFAEEYVSLSAEEIIQIEQETGIIFAGTHSGKLIRYLAYSQDQLIGYAYEDTVLGKWGPIHYLAGLDVNGVILRVTILDYDEIRGKPIAKQRFLKQYKGKTRDDPLRLRKDITGVSGATISSRSLTDGIRKIMHIHSLKG